jgi:hypothetical protein
MTHNFQIKSLGQEEFAQLFGMDDDQLQKSGATRYIVDRKPGYPCRVSLVDAEIGEEVILVYYQHHKVHSPYQSGGPVFVRKNAAPATLKINELPKMPEHRLLSIRGYDKNGMMKESAVCDGNDLRTMLNHIFNNKEVQYIHIHNAKPGCYNCIAERV